MGTPNRSVYVWSAAVAATLGCSPAAAQQVARADLGSSVQIQYGTVQDVDVGRLEAAAKPGSGATVGGMLGLAGGARGAVQGAAAGALISSLIARHQNATAPNAYTYTINLSQGGVVKVVTESGDIREGDCVSYEQGVTANVRRVADVYCDAGHQAVADSSVRANAQSQADMCHTAKQSVLDAKTEADMDVAMKKVRLFCDG